LNFRVKDGVMIPCQADGTDLVPGEDLGPVVKPTPARETLRVVPVAEVRAIIGIGGAPSRASTLPEGAKERKQYPVASGFADYFPDAIVAVSNVSYRGGQQHHPDKPLHWDRAKSADEADTMMRHFLQRGTLDTDGVRHSAKMCWRAMALLQKEIEAEQK